MNRDEKKYAQPSSFIPQRWLENERPIQTFDQYEFPVFHAGPRNCLGKDLAIYETKILLVQLIRRYRIELAGKKFQDALKDEKWKEDVSLIDGEPVYQDRFIVSIKGDLKMKLYKR